MKYKNSMKLYSCYFCAVGGGVEPPTMQLALVQIWWSTPVETKPFGLHYVYPVIITPETGGHGCQFRHPTVSFALPAV